MGPSATRVAAPPIHVAPRKTSTARACPARSSVVATRAAAALTCDTADPVAQWLELLGPPRQVTTFAELGVAKVGNYGEPLSRYPVDVGRFRRVLERVAEMARWSERAKDGRALGIAVHHSFLTYVAVVASVVTGDDGRLRVDDGWVVVDAGLVANEDRVRSQMEGAFVFGCSVALHGRITAKNGAILENNFRDYRLARIGEVPRSIQVEVLDSDAPPGGAGEPGLPPVAPAIANAVFARTGKRVRDLPILPRSV